MMMIYGMFVFMLNTTPYQTLSREMAWRHVKNDRVGKSAKWQYIGAGEDSITLDGVLYPEVTGGDISLEALRTLAYAGRPWPLIEGTGMIYGMFVIESLNETRTEFFSDGKARKIEFTLSLKKVSEDIREGLSNITADDLLNIVK
ncbi:oxidoreductase [Photorhabdus laumondii subsp. laumondii]|uniref:Oxidoreductase n=1 Tax=Photorhabdus laumondii subsp. laumondii TaxID=141679 RepID=A0A6L9JQ22_PHOLM|nr:MULTISPECIES: phage tail protein [Photorhabdus]AXG42678.1 oxidoreductase [Photorhabdus laumondii subsp. laumondii]MCC8384208.1 phage tail protein [Photorhabdus laumondii]MCC8414753.1 phage tail protein [Photorhabdus laumondii]NDK94316.1 oxidoreductase [Photorhabdus laumondii subsp. laumondii]NDL14983.1 oxidoreductase [Photorhabdus laumondii subsp. laumondii]